MAQNKALTIPEQAMVNVSRRYSRIKAADTLSFAQEKLHALALIKRNKNLRLATRDSIEDAVLQAGSMGLSLNPTRGHCYLITRRMRKRRQNESQAEYDKVPTFAYAYPSYRGLIHIPVMSGAIRFARAEVIFKSDKFVYRGPHHDVEYQLLTDHQNQTEANADGVFAVARTIHGDYLTEYVPRETILKIRQMSEMPGGIMWNPSRLWTEGWKKAALRRLYKTLPDAPVTLDIANDAMDHYDGVDPANMNKQEATGQQAPDAVVIINDDQFMQLHAKITDSGRTGPVADKWLTRLANTYGLQNIKDLPVAQFNEALKKITWGLS